MGLVVVGMKPSPNYSMISMLGGGDIIRFPFAFDPLKCLDKCVIRCDRPLNFRGCERRIEAFAP